MTTVTEAPSIESRIDTLTQQMDFLIAEAEERRRQRETYSDLIHDLSPLASQGMGTVTRALSEAEEKGYIDFARSGLGVIDRVVTSFTEDDVEALGDNVVLILETIKEMTQPEVMGMMRATLHEVGEIEESAIPPGMFEIMRQMRDPDVRRGLSRMIALLRSMGSVDQSQIGKGKEARQ